MQVRNLAGLTLVVSILVVIDALYSPVVLLWSMLLPESFALYITPIAVSLDGIALAVKILTMIVFGRWIYVAGKNLLAAGFEDLEFTPGSRIWWFAVPVANLFKPFQGMRELWNASHGDEHYGENHGIIGAWWALWLASGLIGYLANKLPVPPGGATNAMWLSVAVDLALAVVAIVMIRAIAKAQTGLSEAGLSEVFA